MSIFIFWLNNSLRKWLQKGLKEAWLSCQTHSGTSHLVLGVSFLPLSEPLKRSHFRFITHTLWKIY
uniref:Uncharacterized protein n=1 Tax=Anguilla anguilla TaxID=7936 RepID=A0A0E9QJB8_ANGAN